MTAEMNNTPGVSATSNGNTDNERRFRLAKASAINNAETPAFIARANRNAKSLGPAKVPIPLIANPTGG